VHLITPATAFRDYLNTISARAYPDLSAS